MSKQRTIIEEKGKAIDDIFNEELRKDTRISEEDTTKSDMDPSQKHTTAYRRYPLLFRQMTQGE